MSSKQPIRDEYSVLYAYFENKSGFPKARHGVIKMKLYRFYFYHTPLLTPNFKLKKKLLIFTIFVHLTYGLWKIFNTLDKNVKYRPTGENVQIVFFETARVLTQ